MNLLTDDELELLQISELPERAHSAGFVAHRFPFHDGGVPPDIAALDRFLDALVETFQKGERIVIHCRGGLGRSGLVAACLLMRLGMAATPTEVIQKVRAARGPRTVETAAQELWVASYAQWRADRAER